MVTKRAAIYVRVSTDKQSVESQVKELTAIATRRGWEITQVYNDAGISGAKGRDQRPGLDDLLNDASKGRFGVVMVWAIDRLGRSLVDLLTTLKHLEACKTDVFIEQQNLDTTTPMGKLLFQITGAFAEFERHMIKQRVAIGIKRARENGTKSGKAFGRPRLEESQDRSGAKNRAALQKYSAVRAALARGDKGILKIASEVGVGSSTVQRIKRQMEEVRA